MKYEPNLITFKKKKKKLSNFLFNFWRKNLCGKKEKVGGACSTRKKFDCIFMVCEPQGPQGNMSRTEQSSFLGDYST